MKIFKTSSFIYALLIMCTVNLQAQVEDTAIDSLLNVYENEAWQLRLEDGAAATKKLHQILALSREHKKSGWEAFVYRKLITQKASQGHDDSIDFYFNMGKSQIDNDTTALYSRLGKLHSEMGEATKSKGNLSKALYHYKKSDSLFRLDRDSLGVVIAAVNRGNTYYVQGDFKNALSTYLSGVPLIDTTEYLYIPSALYKGIAATYVELDSDSLSIYYTRKALELAYKEISKYPEYTIPPLIDLSRKENERGNREIALRYISDADSISRKYNLDRVLPLIASQKAELYLANDQPQVALQTLVAVQNVYDEFPPSQEDKFQFRYNLGIAYYRLGKNQKALEILERLQEQSQKLDYPKENAQINEALRKLYAESGAFSNAYQAHLRFKTLSDSLYALERQKSFKVIETQYQTAQKEAALLETRATLAETKLDVRRRSNIIYGVASLAAFLGLLGYLFYSQQKLKNRQLKKESELKTALSKIETQNKLQEQRLRISRDLHDNIGSQLSYITSSLDNVKYGLKGQNNKVEDKITEIGDFTRVTINELRDTIWAMNKERISIEDLTARIGNLLEQVRSSYPSINIDFDRDENINLDTTVTALEGVNAYRIIQESIHNAVKYSKGSAIYIHIFQIENELKILVRDNGIGFDTEIPSSGNGLNNLKKRAADIDGVLLIKSSDKGTEIHLGISL